MSRAHRTAVLVLVATVIGTLLSNGLKAYFDRERPEEAFRLAEASHASFPSGHSLLSTVVYLTLAAIIASTRKRLRQRLYILAAAAGIAGLVGMTRMYIGVHYLTDVLAGWSLGLAWTVVCLLAAEWLRRRRIVRETTG